MPDPTSRLLVPAIAAALAKLERTADVLVAINDQRESPPAVQSLVLDALTGLEQIQLLLQLDAPYPEQFEKKSR